MNLNKEAILAQLNAIVPNTLLETLKISYTDVGDDFLTAKMPVNPSVHQPQGLLHGGATVALAETVGSTASHLFIDTKKYKVKGLEISANHLKSKREGEVFATARPIHKGRTTHLWEIRVVDEEGNLISLCKLTTIVLAK
ncbi:hotdog fold thioesterase [Kordia sp.]|uniref:hotdog fold thioesterase n=1 Tax=Kordia sp. TaxID=1965332 RepID=UPI003D6C4E70